ncbi:arsenate reductase (glutaredoxin) [Arcobacteraceae bacterium]|jgi:arsenate reductase|nr:arsenate reductase (glutaredoxin) [Arcobacteraceae bacterium]
MIQIWHNNRCSKSRDGKALLEESGQEFEVFEYMKNDFSKEELLRLLAQLQMKDVKDMLRPTETEYKELDIEKKSQNEILDLVVQNPKLIQRPIIIKDNKAVIARPIENLINLLG